MKDKFIRKYMRIAKEIGVYENPCFSRKIGVCIVNPILNTVISVGYNGPARNLEHADTQWHWQMFVIPNLTDKEKNQLTELGYIHKSSPNKICNKIKNKCPRRILDIKSGCRMELCPTCVHAETNCIIQGGYERCYQSYMFAHCCLPCVDCSRNIIQAGIKKIFCLSGEEDYSNASRPMLTMAKIQIIEHPPEWYDL